MVQFHLGKHFLVLLPIFHFLRVLVVLAFLSYVLIPRTNLTFVPKSVYFLVMPPILKDIFVWIPLLLKSIFLEMLSLMSLITPFPPLLPLVINLPILVPVLGLVICYFSIHVNYLRYWALPLHLVQAHFHAPLPLLSHPHKTLFLHYWALFLYHLTHLFSLGLLLNQFP